jgi:hypothetical protein
MVPWVERPTVAIDLTAPAERRYEGVPRAAFAEARQLLDRIKSEVPPTARPLADAVRLRTGGRFHDEAVSLARQVGADWHDVILANISYDLVLARFGCSTVALATPHGPVVARNMDWWPEDLLAQASYLLRFARAGQFQYANAGWPGAIGVVTGLSARGFALVLNAVTCSEGVNPAGYPVLLHLRRVLEDARDFDDALRMVAEEPLAAPGLITLVGTENSQRVVVERTPMRHALRRAEDDAPLVTTNDYRVLFRPEAHDGAEIYRTTCRRYDTLQQFFTRPRPDRGAEDAALLYALSDPGVLQGITAQHIIMRPRAGEVRLFVPRRLLRAA